MFDNFKLGNPRTEAERKKRHKSLYGTIKTPPRGTGRMVGKRNPYQEAVKRTK